ncbi:TPA: DNA polymerase III subunit delta' [Streptococcus suis]|nr:DNA polymerase III subunit delta' [Streptococcus suis]HEM3673097.1 DNA polymerase III subunit delta' [Streptococcus suis]HEM3723887.1 DNA polymerase III subunit delta' [Streptococcus suis]
MNIQELKDLQPLVYQQFVTILEQGRLAHAYLFSGDFASFEMALFLSQALFCQEKVGVHPCGKCRSCRLIESNDFSDVTIVAPQGNFIKTDTIRELVKNFSQSGFESSQQVFIIRDAEKMHVNAANSLLKVIEEPQSTIHIFLLTNQEEAVLPTIKSRTQIISFPQNLPYLERILEEEGLLKTQASLIARLVSSQEEAKRLATNKSFIDLLDQAKKFTELLLTDSNRAYLQVGVLVPLAVEKAEQGRLFDVLSLLLAERLTEMIAREKMDGVLKAKKMWQANVSLQNCLEYLTM